MSRSSAPMKALNETCVSKWGDKPTGACWLREAARQPGTAGVGQFPPAGVRRRSRRAAQHLMAEANEGAEVDGWGGN